MGKKGERKKRKEKESMGVDIHKQCV